MYIGTSEDGRHDSSDTIAILLVVLSGVEQEAAADGALPVSGLSPVR